MKCRQNCFIFGSEIEQVKFFALVFETGVEAHFSNNQFIPRSEIHDGLRGASSVKRKLRIARMFTAIVVKSKIPLWEALHFEDIFNDVTSSQIDKNSHSCKDGLIV